jgi:hypothetical protein
LWQSQLFRGPPKNPLLLVGLEILYGIDDRANCIEIIVFWRGHSTYIRRRARVSLGPAIGRNPELLGGNQIRGSSVRMKVQLNRKRIVAARSRKRKKSRKP